MNGAALQLFLLFIFFFFFVAFKFEGAPYFLSDIGVLF
jgi:hypothetical protein